MTIDKKKFIEKYVKALESNTAAILLEQDYLVEQVMLIGRHCLMKQQKN
ncbi:TPA: hypothetical protein ACN2NP_002137 [Staphylococcus aureus]